MGRPQSRAKVSSLITATLKRFQIVEIDFEENRLVITFEGDPGFFGAKIFAAIEGVILNDNAWGISYDDLAGYDDRGSQAIVNYRITSGRLRPIKEPAKKPGSGEPFIRNPRNVTLLYRVRPGPALERLTFP